MRCLFIALLVVALASPVMAQMVICNGTESGGTGIVAGCLTPHLYAYDVSFTGGETEFYIGTDDGNPANYTAICMPAGWTFAIVPYNYIHDPQKTQHGLITGSGGVCAYRIVFSTATPVAGPVTLGFAFDNPNYSHDVNWVLGALGVPVAQANWAAPVGTGAGPIHSPMSGFPTLSTWGLILLTVLLLAVATVLIRRRRRVEA
jgi:hypothetical protein